MELYDQAQVLRSSIRKAEVGKAGAYVLQGVPSEHSKLILSQRIPYLEQEWASCFSGGINVGSLKDL